MIDLQWLELTISRTNFHGPKDVRAIEVRLYSKPSAEDIKETKSAFQPLTIAGKKHDL